MSKRLHSLQIKLTLSFVLLVLVVSSATFLYTFRETKRALRDIVRTELIAVSSVAATNLSGETSDILESLRPGDEASAKYVRLRDQLRAIRAAHADLKYLYIMRKVGPDVRFIVDADYGNTTDPGGAIGEKYDNATETLRHGFDAATAEQDFYTDKWGTLLSGYAPLRNSKGEVIGVLGVDMSSALVLQKQQFLGSTIYVIFALGILVAGLVVLLFSQTIIKDIKKLNEIATAVSQGDMSRPMDVRRKDEIGDLAESFGRMVTSLQIMMANPDPSEVEFPHERAS